MITKKPRGRFWLQIDSGSHEQPRTRVFGSLDAAMQAFDELDPKWKPHAWILEPIMPPIIYMRYGKRV
jgi:hypothetical protein